jgi:phytochromobilin:ferredoxin oxidoreductase
MQLLPWGGKLTSESLKFFSPIVIWTRFTPSELKNDVLYSAFTDYYKVWTDEFLHPVLKRVCGHILTASC